MRTHQEINERSRALAAAVVQRIDMDADRAGLEHARTVCRRWLESHSEGCVREWCSILQNPWAKIRSILLDQSEEGNRLRQNSPFCGILTPRERWEIYRRF
ncbi:MAG: hypothetical protein A2268_00545 [Candidatus Raymondbacteria bacterium RifOxyA12_full_50_37]|uniref:Uncharacterized protein n=1 Tax=Candidatus Raymondbacteria bacterium RIFOXYD12_FULL_49_13 TaxID=1817890 RepID=A0A1F7F363_UNCRA|nr:MAG: hypothetical protein A2350_09030 [Candidatus Raymondbacteria bacterium RifOxyB12_full_50_8]OGJ91472.1 MAG: hypothetical protein A2268_00545 [Candidatus Raymondbacteria bacterium RifOxyA12_full_50_37]OGJ92802.1 MAG: hypothetical protein A2248_04595 [Candidatus Raymondbacteria bacterium RIFOXYA2_FULL_49_16]OGK01002.1 MAG: hypothetical protein A2519_17260 [Candidatus Raymondbacteria bacterium RIFOXYD12_FULL_49_13]OGK03558.1 MAG: hypothetical protein A2487_06750 [Candidatus Raymondbacteria 